MDELIRQLTHDNQQLEKQWPDIHDALHKLSTDIDSLIAKVKALDALVDYVLADAENLSHLKVILAESVIRYSWEDPKPSLNEFVRIFSRILDVTNQNNLFYVTFLQKFYHQVRIGEELSKVPSLELIDLILNHFQKFEFLDKDFDNDVQDLWQTFMSRNIFSPLSCDINKLNYENTMNKMRRSFQCFFRWAALNSYQSKVWLEVQRVLSMTFPTIFDSYIDLNDAQFYLTTCSEPCISSDYIQIIAQGYKTELDLFKTNISLIYTTTEKLVSQNRIKEAGYFIDSAILVHFKSILNIEELIQMLIHMCPLVNIEYRDSFCKSILSSIIYELSRKKFKKESADMMFDLILAILNLTIIRAPKLVTDLLSINDFYPWKQLNTKINQLIQSCINYENMINVACSTDLDYLDRILDIICQRAKVHTTILNVTHELSFQAVLKWSSIIDNITQKPYCRHVFIMGTALTNLVDRKKMTVENCSQLTEILRILVNADNEIYEFQNLYDNFLRFIAKLLAESIGQIQVLPLILHQQIASLILLALNHPFMNESGTMTPAHTVCLALWFKLGVCIHSEDDARLYLPCADRFYELAFGEEQQQQLYNWWATFWSIVGLKYPSVAADRMGQFLEEIIDRKQFLLLSIISTLYSKRPEAFHNRFYDLIHAIFDEGSQRLTPLTSLVDNIIQAHPELVTSENVDDLFSLIKNHSNSMDQIVSIFQTLGYIANAQPQLFDKHKDELLNYIIEQHSLGVFICLKNYLVSSTILNGEKAADEYLTLLINLTKTVRNISIELKTNIFYTCQLVGIRHKNILTTKRKDLIPFEADVTCQALIDFIDGNKLSDENQAAINRTLDEISKIEERVVHTERDIHNITKVVKLQELNISNLNVHVNSIDKRVDNISEQVEYHAREIERIDMKTLSYVPSEWGRDVSTLLNVRANNDWRLLGKRVGYSASELKHWAMQIDPSMSLLNEWFMTHKADEATYGLLKVLNDIGRKDVEEIIRKAMDKAGQLIPDDMPVDIKRLPPVFLSYQWGSQKAVLRLKSNLEQAGYLCWMDTGQMGGGDKLFSKIDAGIRGAKVVICCMNKAYAQSDNCSREVHLTISTGKQLIPLQMEKQTWPPEGALGPIMSEYLFIRFFDRKANDENYWPADRFAELLGQIRYHAAPDPDMISGPYHNWFVPRSDNLIFLRPQATNSTTNQTTVKDNVPLVITHAQIMISYQWDYQKEIVELYEKLTKLGYRCWLDIFQMGGGDSLFEKIDTGIRNAKCILACVTPKYTKSINCRREMALSDALKKPIIPLLLEETSTWPPDGPMSMVFAEKPYIDFRHSIDKNERWTGKQYESVLARLKQIVPEVKTENPQRHLIDMQRPTTANKGQEKKLKRIRSAPTIPQSRACSIM